MKKLLLGICAVAAFTASAAFQFTYSATGNVADGLMEYTIKVTEGSGLIYSGYSPTMPNSGYAMGWYNAADGFTGFTNEGSVIQHADGNYSYAIGNFSAGDEIGLWITLPSGRAASSTGAAIGNLVTRELYNYAGGEYPGFGWGFRFGDIVGHFEYISYELGGLEDSAPAGQPLPGVLASLLFGGGAMAFIRRRKQA